MQQHPSSFAPPASLRETNPHAKTLEAQRNAPMSLTCRLELRLALAEQGRVEAADGLVDARGVNGEGQVDARRAERDERDVDVADGGEDFGADARRVAQTL